MDQAIKQMKKIIIVSERPTRRQDIEIHPETTAVEILENTGRNPNEFLLVKPNLKEAYDYSDLPFNDVADGGTLFVLPWCCSF